MADPTLEAVFKAPFAEQVAAFRLRLGDLVPTARWDDLAGQAHDRAFMVAGAVRADLLADLGAAVDRAIADGTGIEAFRRDFREIVARHGWHGWTGEGSAKGEAWRTRVIYRTNLRTSYMAGRRAQLVDGAYRWWVYRHSGALHPRLDHLSWDGVALPPDHPFWATHYPPNGWGCGCVVEGARTAAGIRRMGGDPDKALPDGWDRRDPRTGAPKGIARGWDHSPGATVAATIVGLRDKLPRLPAPIGAAMAAMWPRDRNAWSAEFATFLDRSMQSMPTGASMVVGALKPLWVARATAAGQPPVSAEIVIRDRDVQHIFRGSKVQPVQRSWFADLPRHLDRPDAVLLDLGDRSDPTMLLVYGTGPASQRIILKVNYRLKGGDLVNLVRSARVADPSALRGLIGPKLVLVEGSL